MPNEFKPVEDKEFFDWVGKECNGGLNHIARYLPQRFEKYIHICHPARKFPADVNFPSFMNLPEQERENQLIPIPWSVALSKKFQNFSGKQKWNQIGFNIDYNNLSPGDITSPLEGVPPLEVINVIQRAISTVTDLKEICIFAIWDGFSDYCLGQQHLSKNKISGMAQRYHWILQAPREILFNYWRSRLNSPYYLYPTDTPQAVWSIKREWFYAVPFHSHSSLFGGSNDMAKILLQSRNIEAYELPENHVFKS